jgi:hypothetical protein
MVGDKRLANLRNLILILLEKNVPGDLIETGVWRGGSCILMRAILMAYGDAHRKVWVADSFDGLPPSNENLYPADAGSEFHNYVELVVSLDEVKNNFRNYGLLDNQVEFLKGWFKDTLPSAPIDQLSLIRLDGDMYESTMDALQALYPKLSDNGYVIVDDYHVVPACKQAVHDYCSSIGVSPELHEIDGVGVYWKKSESDACSIVKIYPYTNNQTEDLLSRLNEALDCLNRIAIRELLFSMTKRDASVNVLTQQVAERDASVNALTQELKVAKNIIAEILSSSSWKLTHPFRVLCELVRKVFKNE